MSEALLSTRLDDLARVMRRYVASQQRPTLDAIAGLFAGLQEMARAARALEARARDADDLEAVAADLDPIGSDLIAQDVFSQAKSGEIGGPASGPVRLSRDASGPEPVTRPGAASIPPAASIRPAAGVDDAGGDDYSVDRAIREIMALDNTVGDETPADNLVDLREALRREHRDLQAAITRGWDRIEAIKARQSEIEGRNGSGNDVLVFPGSRVVRAISTCGGPDDGDAA